MTFPELLEVFRCLLFLPSAKKLSLSSLFLPLLLRTLNYLLTTSPAQYHVFVPTCHSLIVFMNNVVQDKLCKIYSCGTRYKHQESVCTLHGILKLLIINSEKYFAKMFGFHIPIRFHHVDL